MMLRVPVGGGACDPPHPGSGDVNSGRQGPDAAALRVGRREETFVFAEGGRCESASPTHGARPVGSSKGLVVPPPKDTGFSLGLTWGITLKIPTPKKKPHAPHQHPCRRLLHEVLEPSVGRGTEGQGRGVASKSQAGDSQEAEGICPQHRLAVPHQEAAIPPSLGQQLLRRHPADVPVVPACCRHPPKPRDSGCALSPSQPHIRAQWGTLAMGWPAGWAGEGGMGGPDPRYLSELAAGGPSG